MSETNFEILAIAITASVVYGSVTNRAAQKIASFFSRFSHH